MGISIFCNKFWNFKIIVVIIVYSYRLKSRFDGVIMSHHFEFFDIYCWVLHLILIITFLLSHVFS